MLVAAAFSFMVNTNLNTTPRQLYFDIDSYILCS